MTTSTDTRLELDTPFGVDWALPHVMIVDSPNVPQSMLPELEPFGDEETWDMDKPFEWPAHGLGSMPVVAPEHADDIDTPELPLAATPQLAQPERAQSAPMRSEETARRFFSGGYDAAVASLELHSFPLPIEQTKSMRNVAELWSLSPNEVHLLVFLLLRANRDWLVRATTGWLSDMARLNKDSARVALDELERKGYVRRLRSPLPKQPLVMCLRPIAYHEEGERPERWRPPASPARKRGASETKRIKNVSAAIDAAEGRFFDN